MCHAYNEKWKKINNGRNASVESRNNRDPWIERKLQILGNIRSGRHQKKGNERKIRKGYLRRTRKLLKTQLPQKSHQRNKYLGCPSCKILGTILKMNEELTQTNGPEDKKDYDDTQSLIS